MPEAATEPEPAVAVSLERRALVDRARVEWVRRLIDLSRRNNLLYFRDLKSGTFDLTGYSPVAMARLTGLTAADRPKVDLEGLLALAPTVEEKRRRLTVLEGIRRRALENIEERGLETLFIAAGLASWPAEDGGRPANSPIILIPVALEKRGREGQSLTFHATGDAIINPVLIHALSQMFGIELEVEALLAGFTAVEPVVEPPPADVETENGTPGPGATAAFANGVFAKLKSAIAGRAGAFSIEGRWVLGNFAFQKIVMVNDIQALGDELAAHDVIAAMAGVQEARSVLATDQGLADAATLDFVPPSSEFLVIDADSSQQRVIAAVLAGKSGVIQGPPGTGKSQTIVNLIASLAAEGKSALFVAEKRAALEVVLRRLEQNGLAHLALDLHGADISRRAVMAHLANTLAAVRDALSVPDEGLHATFEARRARLNKHVNRMHAPREPSGLSMFELQARLLGTAPDARATTRWRGNALSELTGDRADRVRDLLREAEGFRDLFLRTDLSPWTQSRLTDGEHARRSLEQASAVSATALPRVRSEMTAFVQESGLPVPRDIAGALETLGAAVAVNDTLRIFKPDVFGALQLRATDALPSGHGPPSALIQALSAAESGPLGRMWARLFSGRYRSATKIAAGLRFESAPMGQVRRELIEAERRLERWTHVSEGRPSRSLATAEGALAATTSLAQELRPLDDAFPEGSLAALPFDELTRAVRSLADDTATPSRIPLRTAIEAELEAHGAAKFLYELQSTLVTLSTPQWVAAFDHAYHASCLDDVRINDPELAGFVGETHSRIETEFAELDRARLALSRARVRRAWAERAVAAMNAYPEQAALVRGETAKKARHLPLRRLFARAPDVLTALAPCLMASPLSVSQLLDGSKTYFDVVIFDEASQVLPEDAVPALVRARHMAIAGDSKQLPPTTFFAATDEDEAAPTDDEPEPTAGFESLLDVFSFLPPWMLQWHYRSRDESLIAFSNRELYDGRLVTFPGPGGADQHLRHVLVEERTGVEGQEVSSAAEVRRVVELIIEHAEQRPNETLGVIAMGVQHQLRVELALDQALLLRRDLDSFFAEDRIERFFVKNLERVQGDERDAIILTVGYGKNAAGKLSHNFGPINQDGGERRLNVAITRARKRMTVVSAFTHHDVDPERAKGRGPALLRGYLEYVASGGTRFGQSNRSDIGLNPFEADVADALRASGLEVVGQWGASGYRIDLVVQHPERPGEFVLAIECDGASYHSAPTARDRDRLRQQQLESLGWKFHRIWSTEWFLRREQEIARAVAAARAAIADSDASHELQAGVAFAPATLVNPATVQTATTLEPASEPVRAARPRIPHRASINDYTPRELNTILTWIRADGRLRTDDELLEEAIAVLGFARRGSRIEAALRSAIQRTRR
jgi:very-short-patch-repair endonuclease